MAESTLQNKKQKSRGEICGKPEEANPRLVQMGPSPYGKLHIPSSKPAHKWTPEPTNTSDPSFDQDFDQFMESLDNLEIFDDLEDWSDNVGLFMDAMAHPPQMADALWELVKLNKGKSKAPEKPSESIFDKPWIKEPEGLTQHDSTIQPKARGLLHMEREYFAHHI